jgi:hypothetical protein
MRHLLMRRALDKSIVVAGIATLLCPAAGHADSFIALSGVSAGSQSLYGYVGLIGTLNGLGTDGPIIRLWGDRLTYAYEANTGKVNARSWGTSASVGYQLAYPTGIVTGYVGIDERDTALSPDVASPVRGNRAGTRLELDDAQQLPEHLQLRLIGSYVTATSDYWTRGQLVYPVAQGIVAGPEAVLQGNPEYSAYSIGATVGVVPIGTSASFNLDAGYQKLDRLAGGAYGALSLSLTF